MDSKFNIIESRTMSYVLDVPIDVLSWECALSRIASWSAAHESRYVCITNVHSIITALQDASFRRVINGADMVAPDGFPVAWMLRKLGHPDQQRINGPDLMWRYCAEAGYRNESIYLYGGKQETIDILQRKLIANFPGLIIAGYYSPPYRELTNSESVAIIDEINLSGASIVWVSLGCPKQEKWMAELRGRINAVMIGVGAAFDYHAGTIKRAPLWMQNCGLEWIYRLFSEPKRLWRRYLVTNTVFILFAMRQLLARIAPSFKGLRL